MSDFQRVVKHQKREEPQAPVVNVDLGTLTKNHFDKVVAAIEKHAYQPVDVQHIRGIVTLADKQVEIDLTEVLNELKSLKESNKSVTVKNQPDLEPSIKKLEQAIVKAINTLPEPKVTLNAPESVTAKITNSKPSEAIPVTLTDKAQKQFMEAVVKVTTQGGGGGGVPSINGAVPVVNPDGTTISGGGGGGLTDEELRADPVPVDIGAATVSVGTVEITNDAGNPIPVSGTFYQATQPVSGTVTANLGTLNGSATSAKQDTLIGHVDGIEGLLAGTLTVGSHAVTNAGTFATQAAGDIAHDAADSGNPVKVGGKATNVEPAVVSATGDRTNFITDMVGKQITLPYSNPENFVSGAITSAMTGTTSTSLVAAPASGLRNYLTTIIVSNAHATVGTDIVIQDGSGGTTLLTIPAAAVYGGAVITLPTPLRQPTTATAIYCANVTTGASTKVSAVGYKGA